MNKKMGLFFGLLFLLSIMSQTLHAAILFQESSVYTTQYNDNVINQYSVDGNFLGSMQVSGLNGASIKGMAYNNGLMYGVVDGGFSSDLSVVAFNENGQVVQEYRSTGRVSGNLSYGKISFDNSGSFYVGQGDGLMRFDIGDSFSGSRIYNQGVFDVKTLSNGNLFAATSYQIYEMDRNGAIIRTIQESDPDNILGDGVNLNFVDIRGIEYDESLDALFVSMLGSTGNQFALMQLDAASGALINAESYWYGDDMVLLDNGDLVVGSRTQAPGLFSSGLSYGGQLGSAEQMYVTQISAVPVPSVVWLFASALVGMIGFKRKK